MLAEDFSMNNLLLIVLPLATALSAWVALRLVVWGVLYPLAPRRMMGMTMQGALPANMRRIGEGVADMMLRQLADGSLKPGADAFLSVEPLISGHLDTFLAVRLKEKMPVISAFIGDKTVGKLKAAMMEEISELLPQVIDNYTSSLARDAGLKQKIADRIAHMPAAELEGMVAPVLKQAAGKATLPVLLVGFLCGLVPAMVLYLIK